MYSTYSSPSPTQGYSYRVKAPASSPLRVDVSNTKLPGLSSLSRELPMPSVSRIYNLSQAHATLLHCANKLSTSSGASSPTSSRSSRGSSSPISGDHAEYHQWLDRWEIAFTEYLAGAMPSMSGEDLTQSRVLKANHLNCTIQAADVGSFDAFETEFQAIVELAGAVLRARSKSQSPGSGSPRSSSSLRGLDVREPLYMVATRCGQRNVRQRAQDLLARYYR